MSGQIYRTAYEEALYTLEGENQNNFMQPAYMVAADTHNVANGDKTFLESLSETVDSISKYIPSAIISGASQIYNIPASVGNLVGGDFEMVKAEDWIAEADSDLAAYYRKNKSAVDLGGFIATAWIPGMAGVKVLNFGQKSLRTAINSGKFGEGTSKALGLLIPEKQKYLKKALEEAVNSNSPATLINRNTVRAVSSGFGQATLDSAFFELGVAATMYNSPVLEDYDITDFAYNVAFGAVLFGGVVGGLDTVKSYYGVRSARKLADKEIMPWTHIPEAAEASQPYEKLSILVDDLHNIPDIPESGIVVKTKKGEELTIEASTLKGYAEKKVEKLENAIRSEIGVISNGDEAVAEVLYQTVKSGGLTDKLGAYVGLKQVSRVSEQTADQARMARLITKSPENLTADEISFMENSVTGYARVYGDSAGVVHDAPPITTALADTLKAGEEISVQISSRGKGTVQVGSQKTYSFVDESAISPDKHRHAWDILDSDPMESQARYLFTEKLAPWQKGEKVAVRESDIPMLEKAYRDFDSGANINIITRDGDSFTPIDKNQLLNYIKQVKEETIFALDRNSREGKYISSPEAAADKLRAITGIDFDVVDIVKEFPNKKNASNVRAFVQKLKPGSKFKRIGISKDALTKYPIDRLVSSLLHEEGHTKFHAIISGGGVPQAKFAEIKRELIAVSKKARAKDWKVAKETGNTAYLEYLNDINELMADTFSFLSQNIDQAEKLAPTFKSMYGGLIRPLDPKLIASYQKRAKALTQDELAAIVNVRSSYLNGELRENLADDLFAAQSYSKEYTEKLIKQKSAKEADELVDVRYIPQTVKLSYDATPFAGLNGFEIENLSIIKQYQNVYKQQTDVASASVLKEEYENLPEITSSMVKSTANSLGAGAKFLTAESANYGTLASLVAHVGKVATRAIERRKAATKEILEPGLYKLGNNQEAAIEFAVLSNRLREIPDGYILDEAGENFVHAATARWEAAKAKAEKAGKSFAAEPPKPIAADAPVRIPIKNPEVAELARLHIETNGARVEGHVRLSTARRVQNNRDPEVFYPPPVNIQDYKHYAFVYDESITGTGHGKMIYATSEKELMEMAKKLSDNPQLTVRFGAEAKEYYESRGKFEFAKTLNENYINTELYRKGVSSSYIVPTEPKKIVEDLLAWHMQEEAALVRNAVETKYEIPFAELKSLGASFTAGGTSKFSSLSNVRTADKIVKNPYMDFIKTALGQRKYSDHPFWVSTNRLAEDAVSSLFKRISAVAETAKTPDELEAINGMLEKAGYRGAAYDEQMELFANHRANPAALSKVVRKGNAIIATIVLRLDAINSVNNAISANVLLGSETKAVLRAIEAGDTEAVGALAELTKIRVPGTDELMFAPAKMIARSMAKFGTKTPEMEFYKRHGFVTDISEQYKAALDDMTFNPGESLEAYSSRLDKLHDKIAAAADKGEKWTGNRLAEEFNRFVAADVMKQLTDVAVSRKLMTEAEALSYINTFVNRTQGNYMAAQRPMLFQGPIGQAIGLFQTYQFNLMQQLLRHVGEGAGKDAMTLLALQGTIHGMNGLPAFNAINTALIGNASGNDAHKDMYDAVYDIAGKQAGDWLMYGVGSNMLLDPDLKINLYVRGDINPRHLTIVPTNPASVPIVQATARFMGNAFDTLKKASKGGDLSTVFLQGLEHNGLSRPLAGIAQTLQGFNNPYGATYSTSSRGNVIAANDMLSIVNLGRIAGGKPMGEAIALDAAFRFKAYGLKDAKKRQTLGQVIKSHIIAGGEPTTEEINKFAEDYAAAGGKSEQFNSWYLQLYKTANLSQVNKIAQDLNSPYSQSMQRIMGGYELKDFTQ